MRTLGRALAATSLSGYAIIFGIAFMGPVAVEAGPLSWALNLTGAVTAFATFGAWFYGIYYWGLRHPSARGKGLWGAAVVFGFILGSSAYWFFGAPEATDI